MQDIFGFFVAVVIISASGVMAPGPLFAATVSSAFRQGKRAGLYVAAGHTIIEFPLVIGLGLGVVSLQALPQFRITAAILGAASIFAFAGLQIRAILKVQDGKYFKHNSFVTGIFLTGLNPFFLIWWFTIGIKLISDSLMLWSFWGILVMFGMHIWMDYAWLFFVSLFSAKGTKFLSNKNYKISLIVINSVMIYFGLSFIFDVI